MTDWRKLSAGGALLALVCLFGLTAPVEAAAAGSPGHHGKVDSRAIVTGQDGPAYAGRKPSDHPKLDKKLNDRANKGGSGISRVIVELKPGCSADADVSRNGGRKLRNLDLISGQVVELPNFALRKLANNPCVLSIHHDRSTGGELNYAAVVEGARAVQKALGVSGAGVGVAIIDSGITSWHDDLTYQGNNSKVKVVNGQRVTQFVDFVNGRTTPYDDNGHGSHVAGIIAGNGYDTLGARAGIAPAADIVSLKVLDDHGGGYISNVIAALDWVVANHTQYNIRVVNLSVGAAVTESYLTDPLTLAAKRVVDAGVVVVTAAGNLGKNPKTGKAQYGAITAPGNAPWVLTVGAYSHEGTISRADDKIADYSSRGPTAKDFLAKPDVVATGTGIASLSVPGSLFYTTKSAYLLGGVLNNVLQGAGGLLGGLLGGSTSQTKPYLSLTGTSMAAPMVTGTVALMMEVNPKLTPNLAKAIIEYTAQRYPGYNTLTQGSGFLNAEGAVQLAKYLYHPAPGSLYPANRAWSHTIIWGNRRVKRGVIKPTGSAWNVNTVWGAASDAEGDNIVWGSNCSDADCDNIVWGSMADMDGDNIVWGSVDAEGDNVVWGTAASACSGDGDCDNIVWGSACAEGECDNIVWGSMCGDADCDNIVWGSSMAVDGDGDNIVWGSSQNCDPDSDCDNIVWGSSAQCGADQECDNIVWGSSADGEVDNIVWGASAEFDNKTWGCAGEDAAPFDDPSAPGVFDDTDFDALLDASYSALHPTTAPAPVAVTEAPAVTTDPAMVPVTTDLTASTPDLTVPTTDPTAVPTTDTTVAVPTVDLAPTVDMIPTVPSIDGTALTVPTTDLTTTTTIDLTAPLPASLPALPGGGGF